MPFTTELRWHLAETLEKLKEGIGRLLRSCRLLPHAADEQQCT